MAPATKVGIVYASDTHAIRSLIYPDSDTELANAKFTGVNQSLMTMPAQVVANLQPILAPATIGIFPSSLIPSSIVVIPSTIVS